MTATSGLAGVPLAVTPLTRKDLASDQEVRWCPGCGDYAILAAVQGALADLGVRRENLVIVSGIGCSSRFPYYMNTYGVHSLHGRAPALATGIALARPDLSVWVVTGDGDALSIGGNHLVHALRRNVNLTILLFNNRIYSLTKGQFSPTSERGTVTKTSPEGSVDAPLDPITLALGAGATFVARAIDSDRELLADVLGAAAGHRGAALVEIYQNCPIFNDGAFDALRRKDAPALIRLRHGEPITFGDGLGVVRDPGTGRLAVARVAEVGTDRVLVHDAHDPDPTTAFALARLTDAPLTRAPVGVFRAVTAPVFDDDARAQVRMPAASDRLAALQRLVTGPDTWTV
nr:2-oxoacid:ferredoxin oxidoreductase subunit beta [Propionibacterium sp.]